MTTVRDFKETAVDTFDDQNRFHFSSYLNTWSSCMDYIQNNHEVSDRQQFRIAAIVANLIRDKKRNRVSVPIDTPTELLDVMFVVDAITEEFPGKVRGVVVVRLPKYRSFLTNEIAEYLNDNEYVRFTEQRSVKLTAKQVAASRDKV